MLEKDTKIEMLNMTVENKKIEITQLKKEIIESDDSVKLKIDCEECEFQTESDKGLKIHIGRMHEVKCKLCGEKFAGERKLLTHTFRVHVTNPTNCSFYMKDWYVYTECIRVFCGEKKKEVAILHSHKCTHEKYCPDFPPESAPLRGEISIDEDEIVHIDAFPSLNVDWNILNSQIYSTDHIKVKSAGR